MQARNACEYECGGQGRGMGTGDGKLWGRVRCGRGVGVGGDEGGRWQWYGPRLGGFFVKVIW